MKILRTVSGLAVLVGICALRVAVAAEPVPLKVTASWNIPMTEEGVRAAVAGAKELGFNGYAWSSQRLDEALVSQCRASGMRCFKLLSPLAKRPGARVQVVEEAERRLPGFAGGLTSEYQYGGEPLPGHPEVLNLELMCPLDEGVVPHVASEVARAKRLGYHGVCWDFVGYRNYHSCECETCRAALKAFLRNPSNGSPRAAKAAFYEKALVDLYERLYDVTRKAAPQFTVMTHCHPVFLPNVFHGLKLKVDYSASTVGWFFQPHWSLEKVSDYARRTVRGPYRFQSAIGMPMIGCYSSGAMAQHRKSGKRLRAEFHAVREAGARAVMVCELGDIFSDPEIREAVRAGLAEIR
ncbi:MAG TPA: hypothetical protein VLE22_14475 [Bryobacteraceae bacterium]|nr:hypothetical protein [Bryobacteraceae bacterium]